MVCERVQGKANVVALFWVPSVLANMQWQVFSPFNTDLPDLVFLSTGCYAQFCCFAFSWLMRDGNELSKVHAVSHKNRRRKSKCMILVRVMLTRKLTQNTSMLPKICLDLCNQFIIFPSCNCESFVGHSSKCFASLKIFLCTI